MLARVTFAPPYALPLRVRKIGESYVVADLNGIALAYVYFEDEPTRRGIAKRLSGADAKVIAQKIARALTATVDDLRVTALHAGPGGRRNMC